MPRLTLDTKKTLFDPIEIEIDGKLFTVKRIDRETVKKLRELDLKTQGGDLEAAYERLELLVGKNEHINNLSLEELIEITQYVISNLFRPSGKEKNVSEPGDKKSPK